MPTDTPPATLTTDHARWTYPTFNRTDGECRLRIWTTESGSRIAMVTELDDNPSASVTNSIEYIAAKLEREQQTPDLLIEHYERDRLGAATYDEVLFRHGPDPDWRRIQGDELDRLLRLLGLTGETAEAVS